MARHTTDSAATNKWAGVIIASLLASAALGAALDAWLRRRQRRDGGNEQQVERRPVFWSLFLLTSSYVVLIPGLVVTIFEYDLSLSFFGVVKPLGSNSEDTLGLLRSLSKEAPLGAAFLCLFAMVVPAVKVVLLILGACLQRGGSADHMRWARRCIVSVQVVSKWASPDMFVYILMLCLFRNLNKPPSLLSEMQLGLGFTCFSAFCVGSTIASLGIRMPSLPEEAQDAAAPDEKTGAVAMPSVMPTSRWGRMAQVAVVVLAVSFAVLLCVGVTLPCMELHLDMNLLYVAQPSLKELSFIIDSLGLPDLMHTQVSVLDTIQHTCAWALKGDVNAGIAFLMYAVLVALVPILDMLLLLVLAAISARSAKPSQVSKMQQTLRAISHVLRKVGMLDVSLVGVFVVVLSLTTLRKDGVILSMSGGALALLGAEVCHYLTAFLVGVLLRRPASPATQHDKAASDDRKALDSVSTGLESSHSGSCSSDDASSGDDSWEDVEVGSLPVNVAQSGVEVRAQ